MTPAIDYLPLLVHPRPEESRTNIGMQTFASARFSSRWGLDHFSSAGVLSTQDAQAASSATIDKVLANTSDSDEEGIANVARLLALSLPRNRPIVNRALDVLPQMRPGCSVTVIVPVAATQEEQAIIGLLNCLSRQSLDSDHWEALLYLNIADRGEGVNTEPDGTERVIQEFKRANPQLNIHVLKTHYSTVQPIGALRHDSACAVLGRHLARWSNGPSDHLLVMADADQVEATPRWLETYVRLAARQSEVAAFQGRYIWDRFGLGNDPAVLGFTICDFAMQSYFRALFPQEGALPGGGPNLCVRASSFALCGYNPSLTRGACYRLMLALRQLGPIAQVGAAVRVHSSSRRTLVASQFGNNPTAQWNPGQTSFGEDNTDIRRNVPHELISEADFVGQIDAVGFHGKFERWISHLINHSKFSDSIFRQSEFGNNSSVHPNLLVREVLVNKLNLHASYEPITRRVILNDRQKLKEWLLGWRESVTRPIR